MQSRSSVIPRQELEGLRTEYLLAPKASPGCPFDRVELMRSRGSITTGFPNISQLTRTNPPLHLLEFGNLHPRHSQIGQSCLSASPGLNLPGLQDTSDTLSASYPYLWVVGCLRAWTACGDPECLPPMRRRVQNPVPSLLSDSPALH